MMKGWKGKNMILGLILIIVGIIIDQGTKALAFSRFAMNTDYPALPGLFKFHLLENDGAAWGIFSNKLWFFIVITVVALGFLAYLAKDFDLKNNTIFSASYILVCIGTIGNFIDRLFNNGYVKDFLTFAFVSFPSFNFADMCMTVGCIFLVIDILFGETGARWTRNT
jgi:signal peptidase II